MKPLTVFLLSSIILLLNSSSAFAHPWGELGVYQGLMHPWQGLDHLLAAVAVGYLAAQKFESSLKLPLTFSLGMLLGCGFGYWNFSLPFMETGLLLSVVLLGCVLFIPFRPSLTLALPCVLTFGLLHGVAHGLELDWKSRAAFSLGGLLLSTILLHFLGLITFKIFDHYMKLSDIRRKQHE